MEDVDVGAAMRAVRLHRRLRQRDVADAAGLSRGAVSLVERGHLDTVSLRTLRAVGAALGVRVTVQARWRGGDLPRLVSHRHSAMHEVVARRFEELAGWVYRPEVSFSIYGERGVIDALVWHEATRSLLVIELKTEIVDVQDLIGTMDRRCRLAKTIGAGLGWRAAAVGAWVVIAEGRTSRRHAARHRAVLRAAFPADGRAMQAWLSAPAGGIRGLSFLSYANGGSARHPMAPATRVRRASQGSAR